MSTIERTAEMLEEYAEAIEDGQLDGFARFKPAELRSAAAALREQPEECTHEAWEEIGGWCNCADCGRGWRATNVEPQPEARGVPVEPKEKPIGWWNGIKPDELGRDFSMPSIRWGADKEDSGHDIPLYAGYNPVHYANPEAMDIVRQLAKLRVGLDNSNSSAEELAARLAHRAANLTGADRHG